jgi:hypothetical protein
MKNDSTAATPGLLAGRITTIRWCLFCAIGVAQNLQYVASSAFAWPHLLQNMKLLQLKSEPDLGSLVSWFGISRLAQTTR